MGSLFKIKQYLKLKWYDLKLHISSVWGVYVWWMMGYIMKDGRDTVQFHQSDMVFPKIPFFTEISSGKDPAWMYDAWHMFDFLSICCFFIAMAVAWNKRGLSTSWFRLLFEVAIISYVTHNVFFSWIFTF